MLTRLQQNTDCDIDSVLEKQGHDGEYANGLIIRGTFFRYCYFIYTKYINIFFPYDVFWPTEPTPSNQSMENYTGEYVQIGHNVNHFQSLYFIPQPPRQSSSIPSHFGFDKAIRLPATSEVPNKRTSNNMKKHDVIDAAIMSVLSSKEKTSNDIKTDKVEMEIQQKCLQQTRSILY